MQDDPDAEIRLAAFARLQQLHVAHGSTLPWSAIAEGFTVGDAHHFFATKAEGIFKPKGMRTLLSIKTVLPRPGRRIWYQDQETRDRAFTGGVETLTYSFTGKSSADKRSRNALLRDAMERRLPIIWFYAVSPAAYVAVHPVFVVGWRPDELVAEIAPALPEADVDPWHVPAMDERRYATRQIRQRLHQRMFRARVVAAYSSRCAFTGLPVLGLVEAAHIIPDLDSELGQPDIRNGIAMSRLHHAAFDGNLIGIDPDYRVHVALGMRETHDGPLLDLLKGLHGQDLPQRLPSRRALSPDPQRLEQRFRQFRGIEYEQIA